MLSVQQIVERVRQVDIEGILEVQDAGGYATVAFLRILGALKGDKERRITMVIDPKPENDRLENELVFFVPGLERCEPFEKSLTVYMDANNHTWHGAHAWKAGEQGVVSFRYVMPVPPENDDFPDIALFQRLLKDMYGGLLFHELKHLEQNTANDDLLSDEDKKNRLERIKSAILSLIGPKVDDAV